MGTLLDNRPGHQYDDEMDWYNPNDDELKAAFEAPSATDEDLPEGHPDRKKSLSDSELSKAEAGSDNKKDTASEEEKDGLYSKHDEDRPSGFHLSRNQGIAGGIVGLLIAGTLGTITVTSGPLKLLHFGQMLKNFHFSSQEDAGSDRMSKIARYIRNRNTPERSRLNRLGNTYADRIERRLNKSGIETGYTNRYGYFDGYVIDPLNVPENSELGELFNQEHGTRDQTQIIENTKNSLVDHYGLDSSRVTVQDGKIRIDADGLGYFKSKKLIKTTMTDAGLDGLGAGMRTRIMGKRGGISWHPIKKVDRKIHDTVDKRLAKWKEDRQKRLDDGEIRASADTRAGADGEEPTADAEDVKAETEDTIRQGAEAGEEIRGSGSTAPDGAYARLRSNTSLKIAGGVTAATSVLCMVKGLADNFDAVRYANLVLPMMRAGMEAITVSEQIAGVLSGESEAPPGFLETLSFYAKPLYQVAKEVRNDDHTEQIPASSAFSARSIQAEEGKELTGQDIPDEAKVGDGENFITELANSIPGIDGTCQVVNSVAGQVVTFGIDVIGGPVSATIGLAFGVLVLPTVLDGLVNWLAGQPLNILSKSGGPLGGILNFGARFASNDSFMAAGAQPLTGTEEAQLRQYRMESERERMADRSFAARMFDVYDSGSLIAQVIDNQSSDVSGSINNMASGLFNISSALTSPFKLFSSAFAGNTASAATTYDYGFPKFGFSIDELNDDRFQDPFTNGNKALDALQGPNGQKYVDRAKKCFGIKLDPTGESDHPTRSVDAPPNYTDAVNDPDCKSKEEDWTRVRFYIFDTQIMESQACYEGDNEACTNIGFDAQASGAGTGTDSGGSAQPTTTVDLATLYEPSEDIACATGSNDVGILDGYHAGQLVKIRGCAIETIPETGSSENLPNSNGKLVVNSRMSAIYVKLAQDARAAGIDVSAAEGFRTMARQEYFWNCYQTKSCNGGNQAAPPGRSNHQAGVAVDWSPAVYNWLSAGNATTYGIQKCRCGEAWHYSPDGG